MQIWEQESRFDRFVRETFGRKPKFECKICQQIVDILYTPVNTDEVTIIPISSMLTITNCGLHNSFFTYFLGVRPSYIAECAQVRIRTPSIESSARFKVNFHLEDKAYISKDLYLSTKRRFHTGRVDGRIVDPSWIDYELLNNWIGTCVHTHGSACKTFTNDRIASIRPIWLVDVQQNCIVPATKKNKYVALSYVWGVQSFLASTRANSESLQTPGTLAVPTIKERLPLTILNAMELVRQLKLGHLWVDALCIVQDDSWQKHEDVSNMAGIYANAYFTIIASQGTGANGGLPGVDKLSICRSLQFKIFEFRSGTEVISYPKDPSVDVWSTRGWTFQESLFSSRKLIFKQNSVFWECRHMACSEVATKPTWSGLPRDLRDPRVGYSVFNNKIINMEQLELALSDYNRRAFTYPEDVLPAFDGMANVLSDSFKGGFISGLPTSIFHAALLWKTNRVPERRHPKMSSSECLPSWSWAGWRSSLNLDSWIESVQILKNIPSGFRRSIDHIHNFCPLVHWYYQTSISAPRVPIETPWREFEVQYLNKAKKDCPRGWERHKTDDLFGSDLLQKSLVPRCIYTHEENPEILFKFPIPFPTPEETGKPMIMAPFISCTTQRARFRYGGRFLVEKSVEKCVTIKDVRNRAIGFLDMDRKIDLARLRQSHCNFFELIVVAGGHATKDPSVPEHYLDPSTNDLPLGILDDDRRRKFLIDIYHVMWIIWEKNIAYRCGIGVVRKDLWDEQELETIHVTLG